LSAVERDRQYRALLAELELDPDDRADLVRRGFTDEQIDLSGFKSVDRYQQLQNQFSELLPGITGNGQRLIVSNAGYLCPVTNSDGLIVACQVRLRTLPTSESNRYRWLSGNGQTLHLYPENSKVGGELPLAIHLPQKLSKVTIGICEGIGAKPFLASQRLGIPFIGAAGGQHAGSPQLFKSSLQQIEEALWQIAQENGLTSTGKPRLRNQEEPQSSVNEGNQSKIEQKYQPQSPNIGIEPANSVTKPQSSYLTSNSSQWLKRKLSACLATTRNSTDSKCNLSEILSCQPAESQSQFQVELVITPDAGDIVNPSVMKRWHSVVELLEQWGWSVTFAWWSQTTKDDSDIDELDDLSKIEFISPPEFWEIAKEAPKRAEQEEKERQHWLKIEAEDAIYEKLTTIQEKPWKAINTPKINLEELLVEPGAIYIVSSAKGTHKTNALVPVVGKHDRVLAWFNRIALGREECNRIGIVWKDDLTMSSNKHKRGFCADSSFQFDPKILSDRGLLIGDECDQVFSHMFGSTCNQDGKRPLILATLEAHINAAIHGGGMALFMSADVTQREIDYVKALAPKGCPVRLIVNEYKPERGTVFFDTSDKPDGKIEALLELLEEGIPCFVIDDIKNGVRGCKSIAEYVRSVHPEWSEEIVEINSDTSGDPLIIEYLKTINESSKKTRLLCCSPSVVSGISIENGHFGGVFGFLNGILTVSEGSQAIARVRGAKTLHIWAAERGLAYEANRATDPEEIKAWYRRNYEANSRHLLSFKADYQPMTGEWESPHFDLFCKNAAYRNLCMGRLRDRLQDRLVEEGYQLVIQHDEGSDMVKKGLKDGWGKIELAEAQAIAAASILSDAELEALQYRLTPLTQEEKLDLQKTLLLKWFGQELIDKITYKHSSGELLTGYAAMALKNERGVYRQQLENYHLLVSDESEAAHKDVAAEAKQSRHNKGRFPGDIRWRTRQKKAREWLGLKKFLDPEKWWTPRDYAPECQKARSKASMLKDCLNLAVEKISDAQIFSELIRQLGLDLEKEWVPVKPGQKRYKRRRISAQSWNNAELYVAHQRNLKAEKEVETEVVSPPEACDSECATLITPPSIYIESSFLGGGDHDLSQVEQVQIFTQRLDGLIEVNPKVTQIGACDSECANLITPPNIYTQPPFLGGGDHDLSQVDKAETELVSPPEPCDSACATLITPLRPPRGWFEPTALDPTDEERSHADDIVQEIFQMLHFCESPADFAAVLDAYPGDLVDEAIAIDDSERVQRLIADWTVAANAAAAANAAQRKISDYDPGEEVWAWFPNTRVGWLKGTVKWSIDVLISVKSGFMETFISVNEDDWIAPGDWVMSG
jgi:hypothetical protein